MNTYREHLNNALTAVWNAQRQVTEARHQVVMAMQGQFSLDTQRQLNAMAKRIQRQVKVESLHN